MTTHRKQRRHSDRPLPVQRKRSLSAADREDALTRLLADVEERLAAEPRKTA